MTNLTVTQRSSGSGRLDQVLGPFRQFFYTEASGGILLIAFTVVALVWANSPWAASYTALWNTKLTIGIGDFGLSKELIKWINDGLMAVFFFVVGLEIKREILVGELSSLRKALFPIAAALGGMLVPALIYFAINPSGEGMRGWGIPMATDIAFALGILSLLGKRAPLSLKIFLTAVAIVDDIGAVLVIAIFYTEQIVFSSLLLAAIALILLFALNRLGVRNPVPYSIVGLVLWFAFLQSGVHATVAGVLLALTIPANQRINSAQFLENTRAYLNRFEAAATPGSDSLPTKEQRKALLAIENSAEEVETPLQRLEHALHPWVAFAIMPIFALANAGVAIDQGFVAALLHPVTIGIALGLLLGKQAGIILFAWLMTRTGLAAKPEDMSWRQVYGVGWLAGIGFTMALFISNLAFGASPLLTQAKVGILVASLIAAIIGWSFLRSTPRVTLDT
ncbi:MAG: Na+/H+ antiporter NhaA [Chloroflexi bacterium]|nr:MAG: Na+/H+ antiporter NhaA [Chloroflexota bacterium]MBL1194915.1 Na+/H+ antiporter NhaA [Chloroflexota bacterium]NOH12206.1 Na+/H+ antiporter NhaA [Chloroflexota bacterium]